MCGSSVPLCQTELRSLPYLAPVFGAVAGLGVHSGTTVTALTTLHKALFAFLGPVALAGVLILGLGHVFGHPVALALVADLLDLARLCTALLLAG